MGAMRTSPLRERGLLLQRRVTLAVVAAATVLAGVFAGIAAATAPGNHALRRIVGGSGSTGQQPQSSNFDDDSGSISPPAQVPSQTSEPPVAASGGS
jgi:ABC-type phosphate transport system substrate-binding protein